MLLLPQKNFDLRGPLKKDTLWQTEKNPQEDPTAEHTIQIPKALSHSVHQGKLKAECQGTDPQKQVCAGPGAAGQVSAATYLPYVGIHPGIQFKPLNGTDISLDNSL